MHRNIADIFTQAYQADRVLNVMSRANWKDQHKLFKELLAQNRILTKPQALNKIRKDIHNHGDTDLSITQLLKNDLQTVVILPYDFYKEDPFGRVEMLNIKDIKPVKNRF